MSRYTVTTLKELIEIQGEERVTSILSDYLSPKNSDIEDFLKYKAVLFDRQRISSTHLVFRRSVSQPILVGYFTLANKCTAIPLKDISNTLKKLLLRFGIEDDTGKRKTYVQMIRRLK